MDCGKEPTRAQVRSPAQHGTKQMMECDSSRSQSTPVLLTNENSQLEDAVDKTNDSMQNMNYNQGSVKFKRKLTKANTTPTMIDEPEQEISKPSSPNMQ